MRDESKNGGNDFFEKRKSPVIQELQLYQRSSMMAQAPTRKVLRPPLSRDCTSRRFVRSRSIHSIYVPLLIDVKFLCEHELFPDTEAFLFTFI